MTNHPHRGRSYWYQRSRSSPNEYSIGIATSVQHAQHYAREGFERIYRERARRELTNSGDAIYCTVTIDGQPPSLTRFEVARGMKAGRLAA